MITRKQFFLLSIGCVLAGCGGGGEEDSQDSRTPKIRVRWPALGRDIEATAYSKSFRVILHGASYNPPSHPVPSGTYADVVIVGNRPGPEASVMEYSAMEPIRPGYVHATVELWSAPNSGGRQQMVTKKDILLDETGYLPEIALDAGRDKVTALDIRTTSTSVAVGSTTYLSVEFTPNWIYQASTTDLIWTIENVDGGTDPIGEIKLDAAQSVHYLKGLRSGMVRITAKVDDVVSKPVTFTVTSS